MEYLYDVSIQFSNPRAPVIEGEVFHDFERAIQKFNIVSRVARNKKEITEYALLDNRTVRLTLKSSAELPTPSRALRVITMAMLDSGYDKYIYGKQLFKAVCHEIADPNKNPNKNTDISSKNIADLKLDVIQRVLTISDEYLLKEIMKLVDTTKNEEEKHEGH